MSKRITKEDVNRMVELKNKGATLQKIADIFGTSVQTVCKYTKKKGQKGKDKDKESATTMFVPQIPTRREEVVHKTTLFEVLTKISSYIPSDILKKNDEQETSQILKKLLSTMAKSKTSTEFAERLSFFHLKAEGKNIPIYALGNGLVVSFYSDLLKFINVPDVDLVVMEAGEAR